jgi:hypothetical protein
MSETLDVVVEKVLDHLLGEIFNCAIKDPIPVQLHYEFSSAEIARHVETLCNELVIECVSVPTTNNPFAVRVTMKDIMRTKFFIAMRCAKKKKRYLDLKKTVDFECLGENWKAPANLPLAEYTLCQNIYKATYGLMNV